MDIVHSTLQAVQLRLRPIVNDFTCFHLWRIATCLCHRRGAEARKTIGWTVFGGMLAATTLAIFVVPVLFVLITKIAYGRNSNACGKCRKRRKKSIKPLREHCSHYLFVFVLEPGFGISIRHRCVARFGCIAFGSRGSPGNTGSLC